jgi:hypothetical protein
MYVTGHTPKKLSLLHLKREYRNADRIYKADLVETIWKSEAISARDKMNFFADILKDDDSLGATNLAGKHFVKATSDSNLKWSPFSTKPLLD